MDTKSKTKDVRLPALSCLWCDYKNPIEFDLGNHLQANHKQELIKLPIGKGSMETRVDHAIQWAKRKARFEYADDDTMKIMRMIVILIMTTNDQSLQLR